VSDAEGTFHELPVPRLRDSLGLSNGTIRKWVNRDRIDPEYYTYKPGRGHGGKQLYVDPRGLPAEHLETWVEHRIEAGDLPQPSTDETRAHEWQVAADWRKEEARKRYRFFKSVPTELKTEQKNFG